ncbi:GSCOCG00011426001-RA-CDS [Cotesia congregata]|nr:GSCOCG00011426001-RA-CDS [Cotesia congregata]
MLRPKQNIEIANQIINSDSDLITNETILQKLPNKSSSGPDELPSIVLKHLPDNLIHTITILFNNALNNAYFPKAWKEAKVIPLLKKNKDPTKPVSYRPISLTSNLGKVFEIHINKVITKVCENNKIIPDQQYGFKKRHSTVHAAHVVTDILQGIHHNELIAAVLIDLEKAFDSVWLNGLIYTLMKSNFSEWLIFLFYNMLHGKSFRTWDGSNLSTLLFSIEEGLQQGTVNSPIFFNINTGRILKMFGLNTTVDRFGKAFADDFIAYLIGTNPVRLRDELSELLNNINKVYQQWNLRVNPDKCESILFRRTVFKMDSTKRKQIADFQLQNTLTQKSSLTSHIKMKSSILVSILTT